MKKIHWILLAAVAAVAGVFLYFKNKKDAVASALTPQLGEELLGGLVQNGNVAAKDIPLDMLALPNVPTIEKNYINQIVDGNPPRLDPLPANNGEMTPPILGDMSNPSLWNPGGGTLPGYTIIDGKKVPIQY